MVKKTHIFIATPSYSGQVDARYTTSVLNTSLILESNGIPAELYIDCGGTLIVSSRNRILENFWKSEATHILCIDGDLGWDPRDVLRMVKADQEFVAGVYPCRKGAGYIFRPKMNENGSIAASNGLFEAYGVAAGFMLISREAIGKMREKHKDRIYKDIKSDGTTSEMYALFNTELRDGSFWGEDFFFCMLATEAGVTIRVMPDITFDHGGVIGCLTDVIKKKES